MKRYVRSKENRNKRELRQRADTVRRRVSESWSFWTQTWPLPRFDAPLDMRMDRRQTLTARDIVNNYSEMELYHIIRDYGEDPFAKNIAKHIVKNRADKPIETTFELNEIIKAAVPAKMRQNGHPSKQTFQAIRIECNQELEVLKKALDELIDLLNPGGRFCIITFHSLEDRIVKNAFRKTASRSTLPAILSRIPPN